MKKFVFLFIISFVFLTGVYAANDGVITIKKYDLENKERLEATLVGAVFGIYKDDELVKEVTINQDKSITIDNLEYGKYVVKEIKNSKGYNLDKNIYEASLNENNNSIVIDSYSKVIETIITIRKYYGSENNYVLDKIAEFDIYHNDKYIKTLEADENGLMIATLEYGNYLLKQVNGEKYYDILTNVYLSSYKEESKNFNLYSEKRDELKAYEKLLNAREEVLNREYNNLDILKENIDNEKNDLTEMHNTIASEKEKIELEKQTIKNSKEELELLKIDINKQTEELRILKKDIEEEKTELEALSTLLFSKEEELKRKEEELSLFNDELINSDFELNKKSKELNEIRKELDLLNNSIKEKEDYINKKEQELNDKNNFLKELENKKEDVLIVEVPNTSKKSYKKIISLTLICAGFMLIIYSKKKVTNCC